MKTPFHKRLVKNTFWPTKKQKIHWVWRIVLTLGLFGWIFWVIKCNECYQYSNDACSNIDNSCNRRARNVAIMNKWSTECPRSRMFSFLNVCRFRFVTQYDRIRYCRHLVCMILNGAGMGRSVGRVGGRQVKRDAAENGIKNRTRSKKE